jgi:hypothetical protein
LRALIGRVLAVALGLASAALLLVILWWVVVEFALGWINWHGEIPWWVSIASREGIPTGFVLIFPVGVLLALVGRGWSRAFGLGAAAFIAVAIARAIQDSHTHAARVGLIATWTVVMFLFVQPPLDFALALVGLDVALRKTGIAPNGIPKPRPEQ